MSENKNKNKKYKINKEKISSTTPDKSILEDYSKWREDYSKENIKNEIKNSQVNNDNKNEKSEKIDFKESLLSSEITEDTFLSKNESNKKSDKDSLNGNDKKENVIEKKEKKAKKNNKNIEDEKDQKDEILTETQRLNLIYGNVIPLHERRRRGERKNSKKKNVQELKNIIENKDSSIDKDKSSFSENKISDNVKENVIKEDAISDNKQTKKEDDIKTAPANKISIPKVSKSLKMAFISTLFLAVVLVFFFGFKAYYSLNLRMPNIVSGLTSKSESFYKKNMIYKDNSLTEEQAKSIINIFTEDETKLNLVEKWIKEDGENLIKDPNYISKRPIRLQKYGKIKGVFTDYKIVLDPAKVKVEESSIVQTSILLNGEEQKIIDQIYEVFPSFVTVFYYDNSVKLKNEFLVFPDEENSVKTITYSEGTDYKLANESITLDTNATDSSFKIRTRDENSILFVNDKNTNVTVKEFNTYKSTNIKKSDQLRLVTKMPWGYIISDEVEYDGSNKVDLSTSLLDPKLEDIAISKTLLALKQFVYARGNKDITALNVFTGKALEFTKRDVQEVIGSGREFIGGYPSMEFDLGSFDVLESNQTYKMFIGGHLLVQETSYGPNDKIPDITKITPEDRKIGFNFIYDKERKDWFCEAWGFTVRHIERKNIKSVDLSRDMILK